MATAAPKTYPPGFFTALCRRHDWPPGFASQTAPTVTEERSRAAAATARRLRKAKAHGWGSGTLVMPGTPAYLAPGDMQPAGEKGGRPW